MRRIGFVMSQDLSKSADNRQNPVTMVAEYSEVKGEFAFSSEVDPINLDIPEYTYSRNKPTITFESWLEKKRARGQLSPRPATAPARRNAFGKSIEPENFKKWLNSKKGNHVRGTSESSSSSPKRTFINSGMAFERWLEMKRDQRPAESHVTESSCDNTGKKPARARAPLAGKTFEEWLQEKKQEFPGNREGGKDDETVDKNVTRSGKPFHVWLEEKRRSHRIDMIHKATTEKAEERRREMEQFKRWIDPHYRTFEEWLTLKNEEMQLERMRAQNEPKEEELPLQEKKKDARVVFDIWLTMKAVEEIKAEEEKYKEMKSEWETKDRQRQQLKRLNMLNKSKNNYKKGNLGMS